MNWLLTWLMLITVLMLLGWGLVRRERIYQFPFLIGVLTFAFVMPQVPALADDRFLPDGAYAKTIAFTIVCLVMCWLGWSTNPRPYKFFRVDLDERRLLMVAWFFSIIGAAFYYKLSRLPGDMVIGVQMSGAPVAWLFFARLLTYGLAIAILCCVRRYSRSAILLIGFDLIFYVDRILVTGKRAEATELVAMFALAFWFYKGWTVPRWVALAGMFLGLILMTSMGDYRQVTRANSSVVWEDIAQIDVVANIENLLKDGGPEMRNAVMRIQYIDESMDLDYGKFHWNRLVWTNVPAQLVGEQLKRSLMLPMPALARDYNPSTGTTDTGMADAFQSFWYFGVFKFFLLSYLVHRIWITANTGEFSAQLIYSLTIVPSIHAISHQTDWAPMAWVHMLMFLLPALMWARCRRVRSGSGKYVQVALPIQLRTATSNI